MKHLILICILIVEFAFANADMDISEIMFIGNSANSNSSIEHILKTRMKCNKQLEKTKFASYCLDYLSNFSNSSSLHILSLSEKLNKKCSKDNMFNQVTSAELNSFSKQIQKLSTAIQERLKLCKVVIENRIKDLDYMQR